MYTVELKRQPHKFLRKQSRRIQAQLVAAIEILEKNPRTAQAVKLEGEKELYRLRCGDYRIIYTIRNDRLLVLVVRIKHRREVYRNL